MIPLPAFHGDSLVALAAHDRRAQRPRSNIMLPIALRAYGPRQVVG